jgi:hypothetical protein
MAAAADGHGAIPSWRDMGGSMNSTDEVRYLEYLLNALTSGRMKLVEGDQDVTAREIGHLAGEVAAIESMLQQLQSGSPDR